MQRTIGWRLAIISIVAVLAVAGWAQMVGAASDAALVLQPAAAETTPGSEVAVEVVVRDVESLFGCEAHLFFDAVLLEVVDAAPAQDGVQVELLSSFLKPDFVAVNQADNAHGSIDLAFTQVAPSAPATGAGTIARITFRTKAPGIAVINVLSVILADDKAQPLPATAQGASLTIRSPVQTTTEPTATATPPATAPTPTLPAGAAGATSMPTATITATTIAVMTATDTATASPTATVAATVAAAAATATPMATAMPANAPTATTALTVLPTVAATTAVTATEPIVPSADTATATATPTVAPAVDTPTAVASATATVVATPTVPEPSVTVTATATPAALAVAVAETPAAGNAAQNGEPVAATGGAASSLWFIIAVVAVLIGVFAIVVVLPRGRRHSV
ncbi:MAG: hypothetical protein ACUVWR_13080 [Anaerolineae bacterium]